MIDVKKILKGYDLRNITIGVLGGHSALDVCYGAKKQGFKTLCVVRKDRKDVYDKYYKSDGKKGVVDKTIIVDKFSDITNPEIQRQLQNDNVIFIHNRYFWVYCDFDEIEKDFQVPIYGTRSMLKLEERDVPKNQYYLLEKAGIRFPKIFLKPKDINRLVIVKVNEAERGYERAFFFASSFDDYIEKSDDLIRAGKITRKALDKAVIEEYVVGAQVNLNFFYSPLTDSLELMGTDMRRQTNLDGVLRLPANEQVELLKNIKPTIVETGHVAVTVKESLLSKIYEIGEQFVKTCKKIHPPGIIGPFALQGAVASLDGKEEFVIFDVSLRIPGSPGTMFTPYTAYLHRDTMSYGERIAIEIKSAIEKNQLSKILT